MSWHFSQALVAAFSRAVSSDTESFAPLRLTGTDEMSFRPAKMTDHCVHFQSGTTSEPSTVCLGEDVSTWFQAVFLVRPIPAQLEAEVVADDLWPEMRRVVADVAPRYVFAENPSRKAIDAAAEDLCDMGYAVRCIPLSAADVGGDHVRQRYWLRAHTDDESELRVPFDAEVARLSRLREGVWNSVPGSPRVADDVAGRMDRLKATGDGQVAFVAAAAWRLLGATLT